MRRSKLAGLAMKSISVTLVASIGLVLQGCASNVEPENVRSIAVGTPRAEVEEVLGEPVASRDTDLGLIYTYSFSYDSKESDALPDDISGCVGGCAMAYLLILPAILIIDAAGVFDEETFLTVIYDEQDRIALVLEGDQTETLLRAASGDPESQYILASVIEQSMEQWKWLCRAAHSGHGEARYDVADYYRYGYGDFSVDQVQAYKWLSLAEESGIGTGFKATFAGPLAADLSVSAGELSWHWDPPPLPADLAGQMTPAQVAEAERLVAEWQPNPTECEIETAGTTN